MAKMSFTNDNHLQRSLNNAKIAIQEKKENGGFGIAKRLIQNDISTLQTLFDMLQYSGEIVITNEEFELIQRY